MKHPTERSGRIRLRENQALLVWDLLYDYYGDVVHERWQRKNQGSDYSDQQRELALIETIKGELLRTATEMGWELDGKRQRSNEAEAGPGLFDRELGPVGRRT